MLIDSRVLGVGGVFLRVRLVPFGVFLEIFEAQIGVCPSFGAPNRRRHAAILLIGGNKSGHDRWYDEYIPKADKLYDEHLELLKKEGLI